MSKFVLTSALALLSASSALAAPLNLNLGRPDITAGLLSANYNATTDVLTITGPALTLDIDGVAPADHAITSGTFTLSAVINGSGVLTSGTLTITGTIGALGATSPLLTANLGAFGFNNSPVTQIFEFTGPVTGGSLSTGGNGFGATFGAIINLGGGFAGSFASNFANSGLGSADIARIPGPGAGALVIAAGLVGLSRRRR